MGNENTSTSARLFERILNVQDEVYMGAALSASFSVMRFPFHAGPSDDQQVGPRFLSKRMDEVTRAVRWHRIAPPMRAGAAPGRGTLLSTKALYDRARLNYSNSRHFCHGECDMFQGAAAVVARGLEHLPTVTPVPAAASVAAALSAGATRTQYRILMHRIARLGFHGRTARGC